MFCIPEIDMSKPYDEIRQDVITACRKVGFLTLINHDIDFKNLHYISKSFFNLPLKDKMLLNKKGYFPSNINGKEGLDMADPLIPESEIYIWSLKDLLILSSYFEQLHNLGKLLYEMIKIDDNNFTRLNCASTLRFNHYPGGIDPVQISDKKLSCEEHYDNSLFTILFQDSYGGLEIQNNDNWYKVPYKENQLVINIGTALETISNGYYPATNHRVTYCSGERISIPFFFEPPNDFMVGNKTYKEFLNEKKKVFKEYNYS